MVFLQKSVSGIDEEFGGYCTPEETRPFYIINTSNRLLANTVCLRIEPVLERSITPMQRGFLPGRSMLANVIDVDEQTMVSALEESEPAAVFFDFKAAFPSVLHEFLFSVLRRIGIPTAIMAFITCLYFDNRCSLILGGARFPGFHLLSGIRQGCPLSPLCFAIAADLPLRRIHRLLPDATIRAYADDLAIVLRSGFSDLMILIHIFNENALGSGL